MEDAATEINTLVASVVFSQWSCLHILTCPDLSGRGVTSLTYAIPFPKSSKSLHFKIYTVYTSKCVKTSCHLGPKHASRACIFVSLCAAFRPHLCGASWMGWGWKCARKLQGYKVPSVTPEFMMIDRNDDKHFAHRSLKVGLASAPCLEASCSQRATHSSNYSTKAVDQVQPVSGSRLTSPATSMSVRLTSSWKSWKLVSMYFIWCDTSMRLEKHS